MLGLQKAVGKGQPNQPGDVHLVTEWLNWWVVNLNHLPFARLEDGIAWFQDEVTGFPPTGIVEPGSTTEHNLQQRPPLPPAVFPKRPPTGGALHPGTEPGTPLALPARTSAAELSDDDFTAAAQTLKCEVLAIKAVAQQEGHGSGFDAQNCCLILYEPLHFLRAHGRDLRKQERLLYYRQFRSDYPLLTRLKPPPHPYGDLNANWQYLQWAYLLDPGEAIRDVSWGQFQILGSNSGLAGYSTAEAFVTAMCQSLQNQLKAFVEFIQNIQVSDALAKKDWAAFAYAYNGANYREKHYDLQIKAKYDKLVAASAAAH